jgi:hypothetical protein
VLLATVGVTRDILQKHARDKERRVELDTVYLGRLNKTGANNHLQAIAELTLTWLANQDDLAEKLVLAEKELSSVVAEMESDALRQGQLQYYKQVRMLHIGRIYKKSYGWIREAWNELASKYQDLEKLAMQVSKNAQMLGELRGEAGLFSVSNERKEALQLAKNIGTVMLEAATTDKDLFNLGQDIKKKDLKSKITDLEKDISELKGRLVDANDYSFMKRVVRAAKKEQEVIADYVIGSSYFQDRVLGRWHHLISNSRVANGAELNQIVIAQDLSLIAANNNIRNNIVGRSDLYTSQKPRGGRNEERSIFTICERGSNVPNLGLSEVYKYKRALLNQQSTLAAMLEWQEKSGGQLHNYPALLLLIRQRSQSQELESKVMAVAEWQESAKGVIGTAEEQLAKQSRIYQKIIEKEIECGGIVNQIRALEKKHEGLQQKEQGIIEKIGRVYSGDAAVVIAKFEGLIKGKDANKQNVMLKSELLKSELLQQISGNPEILGKLKGMGLGRLVMTSASLDALTEAKYIGYDLAKLLEIRSIKQGLEAELNNGLLSRTLSDLRQELEGLKTCALSAKEISDLISTAQGMQHDKIDGLEQQKIEQKPINRRIQNNLRNKTQEPRLKFEDVASQLSSSTYEKIFRRYAASIIGADDQMHITGSNISCGSLNMNLNTGVWIRFSTSESGNIFHFVQTATGKSPLESLEMVAEEVGYVNHRSNFTSKDNLRFNDRQINNLNLNDLAAENANNHKVEEVEWKAMQTAENLSIKEFKQTFKYIARDHEVTGLYRYTSLDDKTIGYSVRLENKRNGSKQVLPVAYLYSFKQNKCKWALKAFTQNSKPIYGLEKLQDNKTVLIVEGEKTADKAQQILPELNVVSWMGGAASAGKVDWRVLRDKQVIIWPDNDQVGIKAASKIAEQLNILSNTNVKIIDVERLALPEKWDLADRAPKHLTKQDIVAVIDAEITNSNIKSKIHHQQEAEIISNSLIASLDKSHSFKEDMLYNKQRIKDLTLKYYAEEVLINSINHDSNQDSTQDAVKNTIKDVIQDTIAKKVAERVKVEWDISTRYDELAYDHGDAQHCYIDGKKSNKKLIKEAELITSIEGKLHLQVLEGKTANRSADKAANKDGVTYSKVHQEYESYDSLVRHISKTNECVKQLRGSDKLAAQSLAEQIATHQLQFGKEALTTARLKMMQEIAKQEGVLVGMLVKHLDAQLVESANRMNQDIHKDYAADHAKNHTKDQSTKHNRVHVRGHLEDLGQNPNHGYHEGHDNSKDNHKHFSEKDKRQIKQLACHEYRKSLEMQHITAQHLTDRTIANHHHNHHQQDQQNKQLMHNIIQEAIKQQQEQHRLDGQHRLQQQQRNLTLGR